MYCPECGNDAGDANFCPECGADLKGVRGARGSKGGQQSVRTTGRQGRKGGGQPAAAAAAAPTHGRLSPALIWGAFAVVAVVVVLIVVMASGSPAGDSGAATPDQGSGGAAAPVEADTSGSYDELVQRANGLYDEGQAKFQAQEYEQGSAYFEAASQVYAAAWKADKSSAGVGTDYATSLFYSGDIDGAVKQIDLVIAKFPDFQNAFFNKGNYLAHKARIAEQQGDDKATKEAEAAAKTAYAKAVAIDPDSDAGKAADEQLQALN
jgi:hypothetical protein